MTAGAAPSMPDLRRSIRKVGRHDDRDFLEGLMDEDETQFIAAVAQYQKVNHVRFPTYSELLWILKKLGYAKQ